MCNIYQTEFTNLSNYTNMNLKKTLLASCAVAIAVTSCKEPAKD
ncbi:hypothetical protein JCM19296_553 [Nonlabens ulvanivorans]|uniref:Uncharacterized protein n=1 Tax=Nonlabens ulvanivorans TaxID=906888 RepID=A0A081D7S9_NONUL|nr:hypothetical protein JCM19296_553 [Nonlabens ulvanivorans]